MPQHLFGHAAQRQGLKLDAELCNNPVKRALAVVNVRIKVEVYLAPQNRVTSGKGKKRREGRDKNATACATGTNVLPRIL